MVHEPHQAPRRKKMINIQVLRTQKHLVEKHIAEGKHILYCYLRAKSSKTSGLGTPYYIGIASLAERPYMRHEWRDSTGRRRSVPVPKEEALIRIVDVLETREDAQQREQFFIAWYGRRLIDEGGILLNRSSGGESGSYGNRVPRRRVATWSYVKESAARLGISPDVYVHIPKLVKAAYSQYCSRYPDRGIGIIEFQNSIYKPDSESRLRTGWKLVGATKEEWDMLSTSQKEVAFERHERGVPWNLDCRRNPNTAVVKDRLEKSLRAKHTRGAADLGMPVELYASLTPNQRYEIKKWLAANPGATWDQKPKGNEARPKGRNHSGMINAAKKYGIDIRLYASLSESERRNLHRKYNRGRRGEELISPILERRQLDGCGD